MITLPAHDQTLFWLAAIAIAVNLSILFWLLNRNLREVREVARILKMMNSFGPGHEHAGVFCRLNQKVTVAIPSPPPDADATCVLHVVVLPGAEEPKAD